MQNDILKRADDIIGGERQEEYGKAEDSFAKIAGYWSDYLSEHVTAHDVAMMMILLKVARTGGSSKNKLDNYIDIAGYAALAGGMVE